MSTVTVLRTLVAMCGLGVFSISAMARFGDRATVFGRLTKPLAFWHEPDRSRAYEAEVFCDPTENPPREATVSEFGACYRTSDFAPGEEPNLVRVLARWQWDELSGIWAATRWNTRLVVDVTECVPGRATEAQLSDAAAFAVERMCAGHPELVGVALDALCASEWHAQMGLSAGAIMPRLEGHLHNAISAAAFGGIVWSFWPRRAKGCPDVQS